MDQEFQFRSQSTLAGYADVVTALIKNKGLYKAVAKHGFEEFLQFLGSSIEEGEPEERLTALALACKVAASARNAKERVGAMLAGDALSVPLPPLKTLSEADDRYYAASVWKLASRDWLPEFLATGMLEEEAAENARRECADGLLAASSKLGDALNLLAIKVKALDFKAVEPPIGSAAKRKRQSLPGDLMGRRLRRVLSSIRESSASKRHATDESAGSQLRALLRAAFDLTGFPRDENTKRELAKEVLDLILQIVHSRYALSLSAETYSSLMTMRDWFSEVDWSDFSDDDKAKELAHSIQSALELMARSGMTDNALFGHLVLVAGGVERARNLTRQIIEHNPGLPREIVAWLSGKPIPRSTSLSSESQIVRVEDGIAQAMLATKAASDAARAVEADLLPQLAIFQSLPTAELADFLSLFSRASDAVKHLAEMRRLEAFGVVDSVEQFSPLKHEFVDTSDLGAREVEVARPGVLARLEDGTSRVVCKALVNPTKGEDNGAGPKQEDIAGSTGTP